MCYCQANGELCSSRVKSFPLQKLDCNFAQNKKTICGVESDPFAFQTLGSSSPLTRNLQRKMYLFTTFHYFFIDRHRQRNEHSDFYLQSN
jgi:hypothetical protein